MFELRKKKKGTVLEEETFYEGLCASTRNFDFVSAGRTTRLVTELLAMVSFAQKFLPTNFLARRTLFFPLQTSRAPFVTFAVSAVP